jgi:hypothetical protein
LDKRKAAVERKFDWLTLLVAINGLLAFPFIFLALLGLQYVVFAAPTTFHRLVWFMTFCTPGIASIFAVLMGFRFQVNNRRLAIVWLISCTPLSVLVSLLLIAFVM